MNNRNETVRGGERIAKKNQRKKKTSLQRTKKWKKILQLMPRTTRSISKLHTENLRQFLIALIRLPKNRREKSNSGQRYGDSKVGVGQRGEKIEHRLLPRNPTVIHSHGITELRK